MKILSTKSVAKEIARTKDGSSALFKAMSKIGVGQGVKITTNEWTKKTPPNAYVYGYKNGGLSGRNFSVRLLAQKKGWVVIRKA